jgi:hypothetical protein
MDSSQSVKDRQKTRQWSVNRNSCRRNQLLTHWKGIQETKPVISGHTSTAQESTTYILSRDSKKQSGDQWTEFRGTGINDLHPVKGFKKAKW